MRMPKVLVVDDHAEILVNLQEWLVVSGYEVLVAPNAQQAMVLARRHAPDVVITDLNLPGISGLDLLDLLKELDPELAIIVLTGYASVENAVAALRHGRAFDFLQKPIHDLDRLNLTIERALANRERLRPAARPDVAPDAALEAFSPREREVLSLVLAGIENREIADRACMSEKTVRNHLSSIYEKLGVSSRTQAVLACQKLGLA